MSFVPIAPIVTNYPQPTMTKWAPMRFLIKALLTFNFAFLISNCGLDVEDPTSPSPPAWVQKSLPEEWPERGIDAHESGGIFLEWEHSINEDIVAYNIYRATWYDFNDSIGIYDLLAVLELESTLDLEYIDMRAHHRTRYSYKLKSRNGSDNLSRYSDSLSYSLLPSVLSNSIDPNGANDTLEAERQLSWSYGSAMEMEDYCLTILTVENEFISRERLLPRNYVAGTHSWQIPIASELEPGQVYKWRVDTGADYVHGYETSGSESIWADFIYFDE
jgi:hypothetical protein